ncbi:sensor histidine kinase [Leptolyngbya sp. AN02str]|uniref:sensor histidine kinase n=1 Tax=Leptolyngbya sp. AN02str TaxID=3423363 RepID=UPI003D317F82
MAKLGLRSRLFLSHVTVMIVGLMTLTAISKFSAPRYFVVYLENIEVRGFSMRQVRTELVRGFEFAWSRGALWSMVMGATAAGGLSYLVSKRIVQPLIQMEEITQNFAAGHMEERVPTSEIPELNQLASSFNRMAAELKGVELRRRDLMTDLTHELRTPLTIVEGYLEGLADNTIEPSSEIYHLLLKEANRMRRLVNDLQELSKIEAGYLPIDAHPTDLQSVLTSVVERFSDQLINTDNLAIALKYPPGLPLVLADAGRVEQILVNLMSNALRYTATGTVIVSAYQVDKWVWVSVSDTGSGIAPEDLPQIFERFWRADRSRDRHSGGTGVGLAICRRLVELQGGTIEVESELGVGSTFRFSLPTA